MNTGIPAVMPFCEPANIGARLAAARQSAGLNQKYLAGRVGMSRDQLATIEQGRVPLRFWAGWKICRELNISQVWLMTGSGSKSPFLALDLETAEVALDERSPFHEICSIVLGERLLEAARNIESFRAGWKGVSSIPEPMDETAIQWRRTRITRLQDQAQGMMREAERLEQEIKSAGASSPGEDDQHPPGENNKLTTSSTYAKMPSVKSQLENLLAALNRLTEKSGKKTELADFLDAPLASVSRWLSGKRDPGGETTLQLLRWVEQQERQQKQGAGSVLPPPAPKTQSKASNEKKPQSGRKKQ